MVHTVVHSIDRCEFVDDIESLIGLTDDCHLLGEVRDTSEGDESVGELFAGRAFPELFFDIVGEFYRIYESKSAAAVVSTAAEYLFFEASVEQGDIAADSTSERPEILVKLTLYVFVRVGGIEAAVFLFRAARRICTAV